MAILTITTTAAQDTRVTEALGWHLGLGRAATLPEVKAFLGNQIKDIVRQYERKNAVATVEASLVDLIPS